MTLAYSPPCPRTRTSFAPTPKMSTYLVAFVVGPLVSVAANCSMPPPGTAPVAVRVWATPQK